MLILAGVSLNAIVGDNGIITNAQNASVQNGMSALEEWLQQKYVEYYGESDDYVNKIEMLGNKIPNLLLTNSSTKKYIIYGGKAYYLLNKQALPDEIKKGLNAGNSTDPADFSKLIDVYGITSDLKVYYCENGIETGVFGSIESTSIDPNTPLAKMNNSINGSLKEAVTEQLKDIGIEVDDQLGLTVGNVSSLTELIVDGTKNNITDFSPISELTSLKKITLKNLSLDNLNGMENLPNINYVYFYNCDIKDYSKLATAYDLTYLYFYFQNSMTEETTNSQITRLGEGLKNAAKISHLNYLYIVGDLNVFTAASWVGWNNIDRGFFLYRDKNYWGNR